MSQLVDELSAYLANASSEQIAKDWKEFERYNEVGPLASSFISDSSFLLNSDCATQVSVTNFDNEGGNDYSSNPII